MFQLSKETQSTKIGFALRFFILLICEINDREGTITSSFFFKFKDNKLKCMACTTRNSNCMIIVSELF